MCAPCCFQWWRALGRAASRRDFVKGALTLPLVAAGCATTSTASQASGRALLDDVVSIDVHTHPALFQTYSRTTIDEHARAIESGKLGGAFLAAVGDGAALSTRNGTPYAARQPAPGVLFASAWRQLDVLDGHARTLGMRRMLRGEDLAAATAGHGRVAIMWRRGLPRAPEASSAPGRSRSAPPASRRSSITSSAWSTRWASSTSRSAPTWPA